jgi:predicted transcriptional regulator
MGKGANKQLLTNAGTAQNQNKRLIGQAQSLYGTVDPILQQEATNPTGYDPSDIAAMNTASQQSLGGSVGATTGQANLEAARTNNAGGFQGAIASSARDARRTLSQNALQVQIANAQLKQQKQQQAISQIAQLYGIDEATAANYLNSSNSALSSENQSHPLQQGLLTAGTFISDLASGAKSGAQTYQTLNPGCWIAAAVYDGWEDPRTIDVRRWLNTEFTKTLTGKLVMATYLAVGEPVAWFVKRSNLLKRMFRPLFDRALEKARA